MANKQLTAKVRLDIRDVESKIKRLNTLFNSLNKSSSKSFGIISAASKRIDQTESAMRRSLSSTQRINDSAKEMGSIFQTVSNTLRGQHSIFDSIWQKVKRIAATWLTLTGAKTAIGVSDNIVSSKNRLNALNGGDIEATELSMDKMYASANRARMSYSDMIANVSKSMTLAGDAFHENIDNAIRFQEIMGKAYVVGGASATEASTSMYQMIQALGGGVLAGDELRSVREGAPLAYKEIEKFAQKTLGASESLKKLAADGLITSELVVAAVMNMGDNINGTFNEMQWTFAQAWTRVKNMAIQSFRPISSLLEQMLNNAINSGAFEKLQTTFARVSEGIQIALMGISEAVGWVIDNFNWLKWVVIGVFAIMITNSIIAGICGATAAILNAISWLTASTSVKIFNTTLTITNFLLLKIIAVSGVIILAIIALLIVFILWKTGAINTCQAIVAALLIVGIAALIVGIIIGSIPLIVIAAVVIMLAVIFMFFEEVVGGICGVGYWFGAIFQNIGIWWSNLINGLKGGFWDWIADLCEGFDWLLTAINAVAGVFGLGTISIEGIRAKANGYKNQKQEYVSLGGAWDEGYTKGASWASGVKDSINQWGSSGQTWSVDNLTKSLGLNLSEVTFPGTNDPAYDVANVYSPDLNKINGNLGGINDNTGSIADSMKSSDEDLSYLRKIAEMEWKKEYTTAEIKIDMTNHNNISKEVDGEGIITLLSERLFEEMDSLANGVYAG